MTTDLDELVEVLETIRQLVADGRNRYDNDWRQRWASQRFAVQRGPIGNRATAGRGRVIASICYGAVRAEA